jgi:predicted DNA binding CopG/RHH family protein
MRKEYDFSKLKSRKNPYAKFLKKQISIKINNDTITYFKELAMETGIPYQTLINMYLTDCAMKHKKVEMLWK